MSSKEEGAVANPMDAEDAAPEDASKTTYKASKCEILCILLMSNTVVIYIFLADIM